MNIFYLQLDINNCMKTWRDLKSADLIASISLILVLLSFPACKKEVQNQPQNNAPAPNNLCQNDQEGDMIEAVLIGTQEWMKENLNSTCYQDGTPIPNVTDADQWNSLTTGAWCWYNNDSATFAATYGKLYNWYAVAGIHSASALADPALRKKLAPNGWHIPSNTEWTTMINSIDAEADGGSYPVGGIPNSAGGRMKAIGTIEAGTGLWFAPNLSASNVSGFTGLPGGARGESFFSLGQFGYWWTSSEITSESAWKRYLSHSSESVYKEGSLKHSGFSVRCIKD